jgi:hypothetical protein
LLTRSLSSQKRSSCTAESLQWGSIAAGRSRRLSAKSRRAAVLACISFQLKTEPMSDEEQPEQDLVAVINRADHIENLFNQIISDYIGPREETWTFMWHVLLDTSVMTLGAKQKAVMAIAHEMGIKLEKNPLMMVIQLRNSFAHHRTNAHPIYVVGKTPEEDRMYSQFYTLDSNGVLNKRRRHEAFEDFIKYYRIAKAALLELRDKVSEKYPRKDPYDRSHQRKGYYDNRYIIDTRLNWKYFSISRNDSV